MALPTWDVLIGLAFIIGISYGFILRREKTITMLCSTYISLVITSAIASYVHDFFNGNTVIADQIWIRSNASYATISIIVFLGINFLISGSINSNNNRSGEISGLEIIVYSTLNIALIISAILGFMAEETRAGYLESSKAANILFTYKNLWLLLPPAALIFLNFRKK